MIHSEDMLFNQFNQPLQFLKSLGIENTFKVPTMYHHTKSVAWEQLQPKPLRQAAWNVMQGFVLYCNLREEPKAIQWPHVPSSVTRLKRLNVTSKRRCDVFTVCPRVYFTTLQYLTQGSNQRCKASAESTAGRRLEDIVMLQTTSEQHVSRCQGDFIQENPKWKGQN